MIITKTILILEDDLKMLSKLLEELAILEEDQPFYFSLVILTDSSQIDDYIHNNPNAQFDIILLDRDCKIGHSFHILDIERFGVDKVIGISSVLEFNEQLKERGVTKVILKDYQYREKFAEEVVNLIGDILREMPLMDD